MTDHHATAAAALAKCAAYDPWFPQPNRATVEAWAEQLALWKVDHQDALDGVAKMYADNGSGFRPLPRDLIDAVRFLRDKRVKDHVVDDSRALSGPPPASAEHRRKVMAEFAASFGKVPDA